MREPWPTLIQSAVTIAAVVATYFLGRKQGKDQIRHQEGTKAAAEVMERMAEVRGTVYLLTSASEGVALDQVYLSEKFQKSLIWGYACPRYEV